MFPRTNLRDPPGFYSFRWTVDPAVELVRDLAVAIKVPGSFSQGALSELVETICRGPNVPDAVVLLQIRGDDSLAHELAKPSVQHALVRFKDRLPLFLVELSLADLGAGVTRVRPINGGQYDDLTAFISNNLEGLFRAGLATVFHRGIVVTAPEGYEYLKPSGSTSSYFIRAEAALVSSGAIAFCAIALWRKLLKVRGEPPRALEQVMLDTLAISPIAFAMRELFALAGLPNRPIVESFHSYGGIEHVPIPVRNSSLCLISASASMDMHREWVRSKRVPATDVITLVTYEDCEDAEFALVALPKECRPPEQRGTALHHIRMTGENFSPGSESPRKVLLRRNVHGWPEGVAVLRESVISSSHLFDVFRPANQGSSSRKGLFVDGEVLVDSAGFVAFLSTQLPQRVKAVTRQVLCQDDNASRLLGQRVASYCQGTLGTPQISVSSFDEVASNPGIVQSQAGVIVVSAVAGAGSSLLGLSRNLRGVHTGPRLYLLGIQVANSSMQIKTLENNLKPAAPGAINEVLTYQQLALGPALAESFALEMELYARAEVGTLPPLLMERLCLLKSGSLKREALTLLPSDNECQRPLILRKDFVFWRAGYEEGPHHPEVLGSIAVLLQRAREQESLPQEHRLFAVRPTHITLDPENFARYDDGIIQAALLRAALPSELDYRSDRVASAYLRDYLIRCTKYLGTERSEGCLEFLLSIATERLRLNDSDRASLLAAFNDATDSKTSLGHAIRWFVGQARNLGRRIPAGPL